MSGPGDLGPIDRLVELAETLAGAWGARARICTTGGQERALLRMFGVAGVDRSGRPLAGEVVDRYVSGRPDRLAGGVILPFVAALLEYETTPQELALDVASGAVDLGLESEVLRDRDRRATVELAARALGSAALDRIDANRTARLELLAVIGDADKPWIGASLASTSVATGAREAAAMASAGVDVIEVSVPAIRELAERLHDEGIDVPFWRPRPGPGSLLSGPEASAEPAPSGSQRGLAELRQAVDRAAAERRAYARLATVGMPLAAPEQAVVAAFERIDVVAADVVAEIVDGNVDPDRALADHAFAHRILTRSGATILVGAGPLVVGPDLARGVPSDATTRAGRALALQLVGVFLARLHGVPPVRLLVGALPPWLIDERGPAAAAIAQVAVRRAVLADHPMVFEEPPPGTRAAVAWPAVLGAALPLAGPAGLIVRSAFGEAVAEAVAATRAAASVAGEASGSLGPLRPRGPALTMARGTVTAAVATLERIAGSGWPSILGEAVRPAGRGRLGADMVVERTESFDPLATVEAGRR
jgi:D-Lysine 5,6-aminomutase TIM-barrel domain of alpha subunit